MNLIESVSEEFPSYSYFNIDVMETCLVRLMFYSLLKK